MSVSLHSHENICLHTGDKTWLDLSRCTACVRNLLTSVIYSSPCCYFNCFNCFICL